mgnify:CR=1 FL=1
MLSLEQLSVQYVTNADGEMNAVIVPLEQFQQLLEDLEDLAAVIARRDEPTISHAQLIAELKADGLVSD